MQIKFWKNGFVLFYKKKMKGSNKSNKVFNKSAKSACQKNEVGKKKFRNNGFVIFDE